MEELCVRKCNKNESWEKGKLEERWGRRSVRREGKSMN